MGIIVILFGAPGVCTHYHVKRPTVVSLRSGHMVKLFNKFVSGFHHIYYGNVFINQLI